MHAWRSSTALAGVIVVWTFAVTAARTLRRPNDFAEAHWLLDYSFGFMKRGLVGSTCRFVADLLGVQMNATAILVLSLAMFLVLGAVALALLFRSWPKHECRKDALLFAVIFVSSPFTVMHAHTLGYFDALLFVLTAAAVALALGNRPFVSGTVSVVAVLVHESYVFVGLPLVAFALTVHAVHRPASSATSAAAGWLPALSMPVAAVLAIPVLQAITTDPLTLRANLTVHLESFGFVPDRAVLVALWQTTPFTDFWREQVGLFEDRLLDPFVLASVGPPLLALLAYVHSAYRIRVFGWLSLALLTAVLSPVALHAVAWDTARISTYTLAGVLIAYSTLSARRQVCRADDVWGLLGLVAVLLNIFGRVPLMDAAVERFSTLLRFGLYLPALILVLAAIRTELTPGEGSASGQERGGA